MSEREIGWLKEKLFERRTVLLTGDLGEAATQCAAELMTLDATADAPIELRIDCEGGSLDDAFTVMDVIDLVSVPVHATVIGRARGPVVGVLAVCDHRVAAPHALLQLSEPSASYTGRPDDIAAFAAVHRAQLDDFCARLAAASGQTGEAIGDLVAARRPLDPPAAKALGLLDEIASRDADIRPFPRRVGFRVR